jgi:hypothetical protein
MMVLVLASRMNHVLPPIEVDSGTDEDEEDVSWGVHHLAMACRISLMTVVTDMWDKAKRARPAAD